MTDKEKLEALIQKAVDGGWQAEGLGGAEEWTQYPEIMKQMVIALFFTEGTKNGYKLFIYEKEFAHALWGSAFVDTLDIFPVKQTAWSWYLQQAVISTNPISYMYSTVFTEPNKN